MSMTNFITKLCIEYTSPRAGFEFANVSFDKLWYHRYSSSQKPLTGIWRQCYMDDCLMMFNATFNNISIISRRSVLLVEETGGSGENHWPVSSHWQTLSHNVVHLAMIEIRTHNFSGDNQPAYNHDHQCYNEEIFLNIWPYYIKPFCTYSKFKMTAPKDKVLTKDVVAK